MYVHACVPLRAFDTPKSKARHPRGVLENMKDQRECGNIIHVYKGPLAEKQQESRRVCGERCQWPLPPSTDPKLHCLGKKKCTDRPIPQRNIYFLHFRQKILSREFEGGEKGRREECHHWYFLRGKNEARRFVHSNMMGGGGKGGEGRGEERGVA